MGNTITIDFHGDPLVAITDERGVFVPLRPLVTGMGLDWSAQYRRVQRDAILAGSVAIMATESDRQAVCLPLDLVPGFLFRIDASRVAEAVRPKVLAYQRECFRVLADACLRPVAPPLYGVPIAAAPTGEARKLVAECRTTFGILSARELWFALGLPRVPSMYDRPAQLALFPGEYSRHPEAGGRA